MSGREHCLGRTMESSCPDCGAEAGFVEQTARVLRGTCVGCGRTFTIVQDVLGPSVAPSPSNPGAAAPPGPTASGSSPAPVHPAGPTCQKCGAPLALRASSGGSFEARCRSCSSTFRYVLETPAAPRARAAIAADPCDSPRILRGTSRESAPPAGTASPFRRDVISAAGRRAATVVGEKAGRSGLPIAGPAGGRGDRTGNCSLGSGARSAPFGRTAAAGRTTRTGATPAGDGGPGASDPRTEPGPATRSSRAGRGVRHERGQSSSSRARTSPRSGSDLGRTAIPSPRLGQTA
jgi:hypothetical protein